jgi:hypothetical protein
MLVEKCIWDKRKVTHMAHRRKNNHGRQLWRSFGKTRPIDRCALHNTHRSGKKEEFRYSM